VRLEEAVKMAKAMKIEKRARAAEKLLDLLLSTPAAEKIPAEIGWKIVEYLRVGRLSEPEALGHLIYTLNLLEPEKLEEILGGGGGC